jgi:hypothetical protein
MGIPDSEVAMSKDPSFRSARAMPDRIILPTRRREVDDTLEFETALAVPVEALIVPVDVGWRPGTPKLPARTPHYLIKVRAVLCADSDGAHPATVTKTQVEQMLQVASKVYADAGLTLTLAAIDSVADSALNQDVTVPPGLDLTTEDPPMSDADWNASFVDHNLARDDWARAHRGQLVVFFRWGTKLMWDATKKVWYVDGASFAFSGSDQEFVAMGSGDANPLRFAHESGHYFHLNHTFNGLVALTKEEAAQYPDWQHSQTDRDGGAAILKAKLAEGIRKYVDDLGHPADEGLQVLNGDGLADTAPDPAPPIYRYVYGDQCASGPVTVDVNLASGTRQYTVSAPLDLSMSYFYGCPGPKRFTGSQIDIVRRSLETPVFTDTVPNEIGQQVPVLSRHHLIEHAYQMPGDRPVAAVPPSGPPKPLQTRATQTGPTPPPAGWLRRLRTFFGGGSGHG